MTESAGKTLAQTLAHQRQQSDTNLSVPGSELNLTAPGSALNLSVPGQGSEMHLTVPTVSVNEPGMQIFHLYYKESIFHR